MTDRIQTRSASMWVIGHRLSAVGRRLSSTSSKRKRVDMVSPRPARSLACASSLYLRLHALLLTLAVFLLIGPAAAFALDDSESVDAGREGLSGHPNYPWYDEDNDSIRRVDVEASAQAPEPDEWEDEDDTSSSQPSTRRQGLFGGQVLMWLAWIAIAVLLLILVVVLIVAALRREKSRAAKRDTKVETGSDSDVDAIEKLPFKIRDPQSDLLSQARQQYAQGNYDEAVIYLYSHQLVELDKNQWIRLARGKTNRQYLHEIRPQPTLQEIVRRTMVAFEDVFFGEHHLDRNRFESCWNRLDEFHNCVQGVTA